MKIRKIIDFETNVVRYVDLVCNRIPHLVCLVPFFIAKKYTFHPCQGEF